VAGSFGASLAFFSPHSKNGHDPARTLSSTTSATLEKVAKGAEASTVTIDSLFGLSGDGGAGTGVIVSRSGLVVTNNHVIEGATRVEVRTADGVVHSASILGYDTRHDLALLQLRGARDLFVARTSVYFSVGDSVVGVGNLGGGGVLRASQGSITDVGSIIIARDKLNGSKEILRGLIGTSAAIGAGDSGGPLLTTSGKVVGIDVAGVVTRAGGGYAIPISDVTRFVAMVLAGDFVDGVHARSTAFVGVFTRASKDKVGVVVLGVSAHSAGAGVLVRGDVITRLGSAVITSAASLTDAVLRDVPGQRVILGWNSATGVAHTAAIVLGSGPPQ
jgi:S1-C subfamily serine protease